MNECSFGGHESHLQEVFTGNHRGPFTATVSTREARNDHEERLVLVFPDAAFASAFTRLRPKSQVWFALQLACVAGRARTEDEAVQYTLPWKGRFPWSKDGRRTVFLTAREVPDESGMRPFRERWVFIA